MIVFPCLFASIVCMFKLDAGTENTRGTLAHLRPVVNQGAPTAVYFAF